jgi:molybdopterin/thiamine biosynthesis adenylyltransferase
MVEKFTETIKNKKIAIIGLGGIGGYLSSFIARLNPKEIILVDGDSFSIDNMNRQLFCNNLTLGKSKAESTKKEISQTTTTKITAINEFLTEKNMDIIKNCDIIMDATDNIKARNLLQKICNLYNIPIIHGALNGVFGQIAIIRPNGNLFNKIYSSKATKPQEKTLSYVPALIATFQVNTMLKFLSDTNPLKCDQLLIIDLLQNDIRIINL